VTPFEPVHLSFVLTRRQQLVAYLGTWLSFWPGVFLMLVVPAGVIALAALKSPWFLLVLLVPPLPNNLPPFIAGLVNPLLWGSRRVEVVIDEHRIGNSFGQDWQWLPLEDISRVKRFGDVWVIASSDTVIDIPVSAIDERCMARLRR
jgi:hypothetical protein